MEINENSVDYLKARIEALEKRNQMLTDELNALIKSVSQVCETVLSSKR
jgi:prefoldin subunit 5